MIAKYVCNFKKSRVALTFFTMSLFMLQSCSTIYLGSSNHQYFDEINQPNELGEVVNIWEDGARTDDSKNQFEWWYFDAELEDGSLVVAYFYKVHFLKDQFFIGFNYTSPKGEDFFQLKYFNRNDVFFEKDSCNVQMKNNLFRGNLSKYEIKL